MKYALFGSAVLAVALLALPGCDVAPGGPAATAPGARPAPLPAAVAALAPDDPAEAGAVADLARAAALALGSSPAVRNEVRRVLSESRHTAEHKVHFQGLLAGQAAGPKGQGKLVRAMAAETGRTVPEVLALARSVRDLEAYLPVPGHRASWRAGRDLVVAALLDDERAAPVGYDLDGGPFALSAGAAPDTPVLALVPVETDFSEAAALPASAVNVGSADVVGTYAVGGAGASAGLVAECGPFDLACGGGGGGSVGGGGSPTPGLYYTGADLDFVGEAWVKGSPEIEVHIIENFNANVIDGYGVNRGRSYCDAGQYDTLPYARRFDQNDERWSGSVLLASDADLAEFGIDFNNPSDTERLLSVTFWEDDNRPCELVTNLDPEELRNRAIFGGTSIAWGIGFLADGVVSQSATSLYVGAASLGIGVTTLVLDFGLNLFKTNDDYLGWAVLPPGHAFGPSQTQTFALRTEDGTNGTVTLTDRR